MFSPIIQVFKRTFYYYKRFVLGSLKPVGRVIKGSFGPRADEDEHWMTVFERLSLAACCVFVPIGVIVNLVLGLPIIMASSHFGGMFIVAGVLSVPIAGFIASTRKGFGPKTLSFVTINYLVGIFLASLLV
jgi:energy-converting hydrogenase Eha subunit A